MDPIPQWPGRPLRVAGRRVSSLRGGEASQLPAWWGGELLLAAAHRAGDLALGVALGDRLPLVVLLLASRQPDFHLRMVARKVHAQRDQRVPLLPHLSDQARDLPAMEQELARAH